MCNLFRISIVLGFSLIATALVVEPARAMNLTSTFDSSLEGWTGSGGTVSFVSSGGNPGGYLSQTDTDGTFMTVTAPNRFLGDLASYLGGTLSFDASNVGGTTPNLDGFGRVTITGSQGSANQILGGAGEPLGNSWNNYSSTLDPSLWNGDLSSALADVTEIQVELEFSNGLIETAGFDNFTIEAAAIPTPALFPGLIGMGAAALRKRKREAKVES